MSKFVLVVDDESDQRMLLKDIFELSGYCVVTAGNGEEALQVLATGELPAIIFLDITMPVMSGREFLQIVQSGAHPELEKIPVVVVSAVVDHASLEQFNCVAAVRKPTQIDELLQYAQQFAS